MFLGQPLADGLQVVARIEALRDRADLLAQGLPVAQVGRAGENIDLRAGIVDVVLAGDRVAGKIEQPGKRIAEHRAAAMAHMHRAGRDWPRHIPRSRERPRPARSGRYPLLSTTTARRTSCRTAGASRMLMKPGPAISTLVTRGSSCRSATMNLGQGARVHARLLGQHHGGVGGEIAMGGIARRFDHDAADIQPRWNLPRLGQPAERIRNPLLKQPENIHGTSSQWATGPDRSQPTLTYALILRRPSGRLEGRGHLQCSLDPPSRSPLRGSSG